MPYTLLFDAPLCLRLLGIFTIAMTLSGGYPALVLAGIHRTLRTDARVLMFP